MVTVFVLDEAICFFVDGVICEVHAEVIQVAPCWTVVLFGSKTCEALLVDEAPQRVHARQQDIDPQIKLQTVDEVCLVKVALRNVVFTLYDPVTVSRQKYSFTLSHVLRLNDERLRALVVELFLEALGVCREDPSFRKEFIQLRHGLLHCS